MNAPEVLHAYAAECRAAGHRPATLRQRLSFLRRAPDLLTADRGQLVAWLAQDHWSPETRKGARNALRSFYQWAVETGVRADDPSAKLRPVRVPASAPHPTPDDVWTLAMLVATDRDQLMLLLGAHAGLRRTEIATLRWSDWRGGQLHVVGKGGKARPIGIPVSPQLGDALTLERARRQLGQAGTGWRHQPDPESPWVFPGRDGGHLAPETVGDVLSRLLGPGWSAHSLRHRFATRAYAGQRDLLTVQKLLGHASPTTTARYAEPPADAAVAAVLAAAASA